MQIRSRRPLAEIPQWHPMIPNLGVQAFDKVYQPSPRSGGSQFRAPSPEAFVPAVPSARNALPPLFSHFPFPCSLDLRFRLLCAAHTWPCCPALLAPGIVLLRLSPRWPVDIFLCLWSHSPSNGTWVPWSQGTCFAGSWMAGLSTLLGTWYPVRQVLLSLCSRCNSQVWQESSNLHNITEQTQCELGAGAEACLPSAHGHGAGAGPGRTREMHLCGYRPGWKHNRI